MSFISSLKQLRSANSKIRQTKQLVSDVQAFRRSAQGKQVKNLSEQTAVNRAAGRLGLNPGLQFDRQSTGRKKSSNGPYR